MTALAVLAFVGVVFATLAIVSEGWLISRFALALALAALMTAHLWRAHG